MAWVFLRAGTSSESAVGALKYMVQALTDLLGRMGFDTGTNVTNYLLWAESAEPRLRSFFVDPEIPAGLWTERAWQIRQLTDKSHRPAPLIASEINYQRHRLEEITQQISRYREFVTPASASGERLFLLDTNVYVHGQQFDEVPWEKVLRAKSARLLLPLIVLDELDKTKNGSGDSAHNAGKVLRALDRLLLPGEALKSHRVRANVELQIVDEPVGHRRLQLADDEIVRQAQYFALLAEEAVTIGTRDRGMRVRSEAAGLAVRVLRGPEFDRKKDSEADDDGA